MVWTYFSSVQVEERTKASNIVNVVSLTNVVVGARSISDLADHPYLPAGNSDTLPSAF
jgi:hypothetical protein